MIWRPPPIRWKGWNPRTGKQRLITTSPGLVAAETGNFDQAEKDFLEVSRLEPQNPSPQLNLAIVRLHRTNKVELAEARAALHALP